MADAIAANGKPIKTVDEAAAQLTRDGGSWATSADHSRPTVITYAYRANAPATLPDGIKGFSELTSTQILAAELARQSWADVANIHFVREGTGSSGPGAYSDSASILLADYASGASGASAFTYQPSAPTGDTAPSSLDGDSWFNSTQRDNQDLSTYSFGFSTLVHEIGHELGLSHPSNYDSSDKTQPTYDASAAYYQDSIQYSIMSYFAETHTGGNFGDAYPAAPMLHDIAAAQKLYGPNLSAFEGDTTYGFNSNANRAYFSLSYATQPIVCSVYDPNGTNTFDFSGYATDARIDLNQGAFSDVGGLTGNVSIAVGSLIANAIGGAGNDTLTGNPQDNRLAGGAGNDTFIASGGHDVLDGGAGINTARFAGPSTAYVITTGALAGGVVAGGPEGGTTTFGSVQYVDFLDGALTFDGASPAAEAYRLYEAAFGRAPDPVGFDVYAHALAGGTALHALAATFAASPEFAADTAGFGDRQYVDYLYQTVLHRAPDGGGEASYVADLAAGKTRVDLLQSFSESPENQAGTAPALAHGLWLETPAGAEVSRIYDAALGRLPDPSGLAAYVTAVQGGLSLHDLALEFLNSAEFQAKSGGLDNRGLVDLLYQTTLHRAPDGGGEAFYVAALQHGLSHADLLADFSESLEHQAYVQPLIDHGIVFTG